jgi:hypothetical protein
VGGLGDLEHRAVVAVRSTVVCCAEHVAVVIGDQTAGRIGTVGAVEADQGGEGAA